MDRISSTNTFNLFTLSDTMQVDNVSCKCLLFALRVSIKRDPWCFCVVARTCCCCSCLTDVLSSEPCSLPCAVGWIDADRAQKHGMDEFISANPCSFDHASLFEMVQRLTLDHRLNDTFCCLVSDFCVCPTFIYSFIHSVTSTHRMLKCLKIQDFSCICKISCYILSRIQKRIFTVHFSFCSYILYILQ